MNKIAILLFALIAGPAQAAAPSYFGVTRDGGVYGQGTVFEAVGSKITTLYSFCAMPNCADGAHPVGVVKMPDGSLVGVTKDGGAPGVAAGMIFRLSQGPQGWVEQPPNTKLCFYWHDCARFGRPKSQLVLVRPNEIEDVSEAPDGKSVLWTYTMHTRGDVLSPVKYFRQ